MRVISKARLRDFWQQHPDAEQWLKMWFRTACAADWSSISDVRRTYPQADAVTLTCGLVVTVFNVRGNNYRLITGIVYPVRTVYVRLVLTHPAYDRENWKATLCRE